MVQVQDLAKYILESCGQISAMKLQKLFYYSQAWSLIWDECSLFEEDIQAWANGPVVPELYKMHRGIFSVSAQDFKDGDSSLITGSAKETVDSVIKHYGDKTGQWLSDLSHSERPWVDARGTLKAGERGTETITNDSMAEYYGSL